MKVAMYYNNRDIRLEEMPIPEIGSDELLVKVIASGICGSDVMEWYRIKKAPLVLGHEITGIVEKRGDDIQGYKPGSRVFVTHHVPCNQCRYCLDGNETVCETLRTTTFYPGGFAEYLRVPRINRENGTLMLPEDVSFEDGTFVEPLGCVVRGQRKANVKKGHTVLVLGSGISGLLHIQLAKARGAAKVIATDISGYRLRAARKFGADAVIDAKDDVAARVRSYNHNRLADRVIVCTGAFSAFKQALQCVDRGGRILFFAPAKPEDELPVNIWELWRNGITLTVSYAAAKRDLKEAMELIQSGRINVRDMITHRLPLSRTAEGFRLVSEGDKSIKVIIELHRE